VKEATETVDRERTPTPQKMDTRVAALMCCSLAAIYPAVLLLGVAGAVLEVR